MPAHAAATLLSQGKPATASSVLGGNTAAMAVDGNTTGTRWESTQGVDPQWLQVDLGSPQAVTQVVLTWETAAAKAFQIQVSSDGTTWTNVYSTTTGTGGTQTLTVNGTGRYVRMYGTARTTQYGYSLWEFQVYGTSPASCGTTDVAQGAAASASSVTGTNTAALAVDGNAGTRWESAYSDPQWLQVDLGTTQNICGVTINWETAAAKSFTLAVAASATGPWTTIYTTTSGAGGVQALTGLTGSGRYLRMNGTARTTQYGYSVWELQVFSTGSTSSPTPTTTSPTTSPSPSMTPTSPPGCGSTNVAQGKAATASSVSAGNSAALAVDGNAGTRWESAYADPQWLQVDLGSSQSVCGVTINWETAAAKNFTLQVSTDGTTWTAAYTTTGGAGGNQAYPVSGTARYVRMNGTARTTGYGYSIWELQVFVSGASPTTSASPTGTPTGPVTGPDIALFQPVTASSYVGGNAPAAALDGSTTTRWEATQGVDPAWLQVDLGGTASITGVVLNWESAYATAYQIQTSPDAKTWTTIYSTTTGKGGVETIPATGSGRYVRFYGTARATGYGYSLWEFEVHGTVNRTNTDPPLLSGPTKPPATTGQFQLSAPADKSMDTATRRPAFSWAGVSGAAKYQLWVNVSRTDYDFTQSGALLDLYTKVAESTTTSYTSTSWDLPDRWTYKWYVQAVDGSGAVISTSNIRTFSVYLPNVETVDDGVNLINGERDLNKDGTIEPYEDWHNPVSVRVADLLSRMTTDEKVYQMFYNNQQYPQSGWIFGPEQPGDLQANLLASTATRLGIPPIAAGDTIHGYSTTYPAQSALAAGKDYALDYKLGDMQRKEETDVGARGVLGPLAEVGTKVIYPRIQEGNGEDATVAAAQVKALVAGLQGGPELNDHSVLATVKHWPGQGAGGEVGIVYDATTIKYHLIPFRAAIEAGAVNVMPGYAGATFLDPSGKGAGDSKPILDYLRDNLGYTGMITTDWLPSGQPWLDAANAGADVMGGADPGATGFSLGQFEAAVPIARINDAVTRILTLKFEMGLFDMPYGDPVNGSFRWHQPSYVQLATQAEQESLTLLKNDGVLPLKLNKGDSVVVGGPIATDTGACCIWTSYFHQQYGSLDFLDAIKARGTQAGVNVVQDSATGAKVAILALGEPYYTHATFWPQTQDYLPSDQTALISQFKSQGIPVVVLLDLPRPYVISDWINQADAVVVTYRGGEEEGPATASLLWGDIQPQGHLPWQLPASLDQVVKAGGCDCVADSYEEWDLPFDLGATDAERQQIRSLIDQGIQPQPIYGKPLFQYGFGLTHF
jgi:beta-glucosidase-like glycosyl hydrolase